MPHSFDIVAIGGRGLVGGSEIAWDAASASASTAPIEERDIAFRAARGHFGLVWVQIKGASISPCAHPTLQPADLRPSLAGAPRKAAGTDATLQPPSGRIFCLNETEFAGRATPMAHIHNESRDAGTRMPDRNEVRAMPHAPGDSAVGPPGARVTACCPRDRQSSPLPDCVHAERNISQNRSTSLPTRSRSDRTEPPRLVCAPRR